MPPARPDETTADTDRYLTSRQVRARFGEVSDMWIWRRLTDGSGFPPPIEIGRRPS